MRSAPRVRDTDQSFVQSTLLISHLPTSSPYVARAVLASVQRVNFFIKILCEFVLLAPPLIRRTSWLIAEMRKAKFSALLFSPDCVRFLLGNECPGHSQGMVKLLHGNFVSPLMTVLGFATEASFKLPSYYPTHSKLRGNSV